MAKKNYMVGFYRVSGIPGVIEVECPLLPSPEANYAALLEQVRQKFPQCHESLIRREGSKVVSRDASDTRYLDEQPGQTLRNLFPEDTPDEASRNIGSVFWEGESWEITLRYFRAKAACGLALINRMNGSACPFTQQFHAGQLVTELPRLVASLLPNCKNLSLRFRPTGKAPENEITRIPGAPLPKTKLK